MIMLQWRKALRLLAVGGLAAASAGSAAIAAAQTDGSAACADGAVAAAEAVAGSAAAAHGGIAADAALPQDRIGSLRLNLARVDSEAALLRQAPLVVQAHPVGAATAHATGRSAGKDGRALLHYVQRLQPIETLKGRPPAELRLVLPGVEPLPAAKNPLNEMYPGPLADDEAYVLFLRPTELPGLYTVIGGWQGIYPIGDDGRTIALAGAGFPQLGGLTPAELRSRLRALAQQQRP